MVFDFAAMPPEINSARMYTGPGSGPMMAAAAAWNSTAGESEHDRGRLAVGDRRVGRRRVARAVVAGNGRSRPALPRMDGNHGRRTRAGGQPSHGVGGRLRGGVRPDGATAGDRGEPDSARRLGRHQLLGQNTPAIMATEALYGEMWAQDAAAMYGYAGSSASAAV